MTMNKFGARTTKNKRRETKQELEKEERRKREC